MCRWGNARANKYWEAALPGDFVPDDAKVEQFIRSKYEYKKFVRPGPMPEPETLDVSCMILILFNLL
jgi:stromal membrane-associated protein